MWTEAENFLKRCRLRYAPDTVEGKANELKTFHRWLTDNKLDHYRIEQSDIQRFLLSLRWCRQSKCRVLHTLRQLYAFMGLPDPAPRLNLAPDKRRTLPRVPPKRTVERLVEHIAAPYPELTIRNRLMVELAYGSGLRRKELALLNVEDIDLSGRCVHVCGKGDKPRVVPLTTEGVRLMREYLADRRHHRSRGPLLQNYWYGTRMQPRSISHVFKRITGHNTHSFRHACATHMLENGCNLRHIQELLGHTKISTTQLYTRVDRSRLAAVLATTHPRRFVRDR